MRDEDGDWYTLGELRALGALIETREATVIEPGWAKHPVKELWRKVKTRAAYGTMA